MSGALLGAIIIFGFQNCSNAKFQMVGDDEQGSLGNSPILCDPFTTPGGCSTTTTKGLLGNVYYLPNGQFVDDYINTGIRQKVRIQMSKLDVPERAWSAGFQLPDGSLVNADNNQPLIEWFAIDFKGFIEMPATETPGDYQFAFASDDGAVLNIDGVEVINHDGHHPTQWKCSTVKVTLPAGAKFPIRVKYFQGPRYHIALQLFWRPWSQRSKPCDGSARAGFEIVPETTFSH